ncbi:MAG TPA: tripartite tricarboxylate transporter substrate-binding protein [Caldilineaceae bacterium]|nr:tripartite tricarboxylate transporter substrate-binding protein [Caldilineaceae bacterium]
MHRRHRAFVLVAVLALALLAACTAVAPPAAPGASPTAAPAAEGAQEPAAEGEAAEFPTEAINIMAPASPGGGWDQTARAMQAALAASTGQNVQVYNVPGAGGTVGLAQFVNDHAGDPHQLMVGGLVMVGAIVTNQSPVTLEQVTPIASLTVEWEAIVVPADSEYETLEQLIEAFRADPTSISWGGGSAGGTDHILVGLLAQAAGVAPDQINYIAHSGGGEALASLLSGAVTAGVSGIAEFRDQVEAGTLRWLAVSSDAPIEGIDAPTIQASGMDVVLPNWRAVFAPPNLTDEQRAAVIEMITQMHETPEWQDALEANGWTDFFQTGDDFAAFLSEEQARVEGVLQEIGLTQ